MIKRSLESLILHIIGFLLVWEWLRPLEVFGDMIDIKVFVIYLGLAFLLSYLQIPTIISFVINFGFIITVINQIYFDVSFAATFWPANLVNEIKVNIGHMFDGEWLAITNAFRTLLLYILLWLLVYLLHYWIIIRKRIFFFLLLTIIYLTVMDTFAPYDATISMIRTIMIGFFALGVLAFYRLSESEKLPIKTNFKKKWIWSLIGMILLSTSIGVLVPKAGPKWPDPIPFIQSYATHHLGNGNGPGVGISKIGYDEDDSRLGGPFIGDDTVVFTASSPTEEYWRVETKDLYTGKGWETSVSDQMVTVNGKTGGFPLEPVSESFYMEEEFLATIDLVGVKTHVIYPQGTNVMQFDLVDPPDFQLNYANEKVEADFLSETNSYNTYYQKPNFEVFSLREVKDSQQLDEQFLERYTQVPESLPERVKELAEMITEAEDNWYDQARAIESYLTSYRFSYDTQNVAVPEREEDYVDQFLFETMIGYCDNFSSSMVVLLRTLDIPARWVKGYAPGESISDNEFFTVYEISNNNAHSWVEVFFPGIGWVPFEPTKGFENPAEFYYDLSKSQTPPDDSFQDEITPPEMDEPVDPGTEEDPAKSDKPEEKESNFSLMKVLGVMKDWGIGVLITAAIAALLLFVTRRLWVPYWLLFKYRNKTDNYSFEKAYMSLIKQLKWNGFVKKEGETLRNFADSVDNYFESNEMQMLTNHYERVLYRNDYEGSPWDNVHAYWEQLLRRLTKFK